MADGSQYFELHALLKGFYKKLKQEWDQLVEADKLSISQFRLLYRLHHEGPQKAATLAEVLDVTPGAVTGMADKLMERGLLERKRHSEDRRVVFLQITGQGRSLIESLLHKNKEHVSSFFKHLPDEDLEHLKRILNDVLTRADLSEKE